MAASLAGSSDCSPASLSLHERGQMRIDTGNFAILPAGENDHVHTELPQDPMGPLAIEAPVVLGRPPIAPELVRSGHTGY